MTPPHALLGVLHRQHAHIAELLSHVLDVSGPERSTAMTELLRYLALHESAEQTFMHPVGLRTAGDAAAVQGRMAEEGEIVAVITNLEGVKPDSMDFLIYISLLEEAFHSHSRAEEEVEASVLGANVGNDELERIAQDLALVDLWMDPATASIPGSVAHLPWAGNHLRGFGELHRRSLRAFEAVARTR